MGAKQFGARLRELRKQAGTTQRELAKKINVDFSYLSKIENGVVPPPSDDVISKLAEVLNADKDELLILAGRIPAGVATVLLNNPEMLELVKSRWARRIFKPLNEATTGLHNLRRGVQDLTKDTGLFFKEHQGLSRAAISVAMVLAIVASLWFASPVRALDIDVDYPSSGTLGSAYEFTVTVNVQNSDLLPIGRVDLALVDGVPPTTYSANCTHLPLNTGTKVYTSTQTGGGPVTVLASTTSGWGYAYSTSRTGYGYREPGGWGYHYPTGSDWGYGYGYDSYIGETSIIYTVTWTPPSTWSEGTYYIYVRVYGNGGYVFTTEPPRPSFTLSAPVPVVRAPAVPGVGPIPSVTTGVSDFVTDEGVFTKDVIVQSGEGVVELTIAKGTVGLIEGEPLSEISITEMEDPPPPPADSNVIGLTYQLEPSGATFGPAITLTFHYDPDLIPSGVAEENLVIAMWDEEAGEWVNLVCTVNPVTNTITASVSHFTPFTVIAYTRSASLTVTGLVITPAKVDIGETVTVSAMVANAGDLTGSYMVALRINNVAVAIKEVTVIGRASQGVTFTTSGDVAGTYAVSVDGLAGTFTVREAVLPLPPVVVVVPPVAPPPVVPPVAPPNWWLMGGIIAAVAVIVGLLVYFLGWRRRV